MTNHAYIVMRSEDGEAIATFSDETQADILADALGRGDHYVISEPIDLWATAGEFLRDNDRREPDGTPPARPGSIDPTIAEMLEAMEQEHPSEMADDREADYFDRAAAIYWFGANHHGGQSSNLYSALSTSDYRPAFSERWPTDNAAPFYRVLVREFLD